MEKTIFNVWLSMASQVRSRIKTINFNQPPYSMLKLCILLTTDIRDIEYVYTQYIYRYDIIYVECLHTHFSLAVYVLCCRPIYLFISNLLINYAIHGSMSICAIYQ